MTKILTRVMIDVDNLADGVKYVDGCPNVEPEKISEADYYKKLREFKF